VATTVMGLREATERDATAEISHCVRDAKSGDTNVFTGDYIGFVGKELLAVNPNRVVTVCETIDALGFSRYDIGILIYGKDATDEEAQKIEAYAKRIYRGKEFYVINGGQDVYDYILIAE